MLADLAQVRARLADTQAQLAAIEAERQATHQELIDLKRKPFTARARSDDPTPAKPRGRPAGHPGSSRRRPTRIDHIQAIPVGDSCPDCGTPFSGTGTTRERVIEDIDLVRPTLITKYVIERRWCPQCRTYHEDALTAALPRHRLGLHVLLFVVYQKVALGLSYGKIRHELRTYFGLTVSAGELPGMVAEIAAVFGPAYARLLELMRHQAAIHIDETSWRVDGVPHWLWVCVNDVVALYVVSRSRGSKVPQALLGPDFDGVVISDFFSAYSPLDVAKAKCWAHLLRDSFDYAKGQDADRARRHFHRSLHTLFLEMGIALEAVQADQGGRGRVYDEMRTKLWRFASDHWRTWQCQQLAERIKKYLDDLVVWLIEPAVDPTNNAAELMEHAQSAWGWRHRRFKDPPATYAALSQPDVWSQGSLTRDASYSSPMARLSTLSVSAGATTILSRNYGCDNAGNLTSLTDTTFSTPLGSQTFAYDDRDRVTSWTSSLGSETYTYDPIGNLTSKPGVSSRTVSVPIRNDSAAESSETINLTLSSSSNATLGAPNPATLTIIDDETPPPTGDELYTYDLIGNLTSKTGVGAYSYSAQSVSCPDGALSKPHVAVSAGAASYCYDQNGNMRSGGTRTNMLWDAENRPTSITNSGVTETFSYDADGERINRASGGSTTVYLGGLWEETSAGAVKQYYTFNGTVAAVRDSTIGVSYIHGDHLGSVSVTSGAVAGQQRFGPWGAITSGGSSATARNYTGRYLDSTTGLLYYHAHDCMAGVYRLGI